jgi:hypothetical protein
LSEYQYYEFQAVDRPLSDDDRAELRALSSRARITGTSFTNTYEWGDFKGDPAELMRRWFDLHLYSSNWGTHRLMIRLPKRLVQREVLDRTLRHVDCATLEEAGDNLILDMYREELEPETEEDEGPGLLSELAPLRAAMLGGDLRLFYLLWLTAVETDAVKATDPEPLTGLGPVDGALESFADFFQIDWDLVQAAAERPAASTSASPTSATTQRAIATLSDEEKTGWLTRLISDDPYAATELRAFVRNRLQAGASASAEITLPRTAGELLARAEAARKARQEAADKKAEAERRAAAAEAERIRRQHLDRLKKRGEAVWNDIESEIARRSAGGYARATELLQSMKEIAEEEQTTADFSHRMHSIRERHASKGRFIERLKDLG